MATAEGCSVCEKGAGRYFCTGCQKYFCKKDFQNHRESLNKELYEIVEDRNGLQEKMSNSKHQQHVQSPLLLQIDEWEKVTTEKVKRVAQQTRQQITRILNSRQTEITTEFQKLSQDLRQLEETEDFAEQDLQSLRQKISQLGQKLKQLAQPPEIELNLEESQKVGWDYLIYVVEKDSYSDQQKASQRETKTERELLPSGQQSTFDRPLLMQTTIQS